MTIKFNPSNPIIQLCMEGMSLEDSGKVEESLTIFLTAWNQTSDDFERFIVAYHLGIRQKHVADQLEWMEKSLSYALKINDDNVKSAYPTLYSSISKYYEALNESEKSRKNQDLANSYAGRPVDAGPFYHGTKAGLQVGNLLTAGGKSNYETDLKMNHIYFTANINGAGLAAALAKGTGSDRIYIVEPIGEFENDPNLTDKKFPGNLTRSYRSEEPLRIVSEISEWAKLSPSGRQEWVDKLAKIDGEIIN